MRSMKRIEAATNVMMGGTLVKRTTALQASYDAPHLSSEMMPAWNMGKKYCYTS